MTYNVLIGTLNPTHSLIHLCVTNERMVRVTQGTFPEPLEPAANSFVCTDNTAMLQEIFNQTFGDEYDMRFPVKKCRTAKSRCDQCVQQSRCASTS